MGVAALPLYLVACYPTTDDVNSMAAAEREYAAGLHEGTVDTMTEQHAAMTPELRAEFEAMRGQYAAVVSQLKDRAGETVATGPSVGGIGENDELIPWLLGLFNLGWLYPFIKGFGKSRASDEVAQATSDITAIKLDLATAAKPGAAVPSDVAG
jgi:hypothetical protein